MAEKKQTKTKKNSDNPNQKKNLYSFNIRKKFTNLKNFNVKKKYEKGSKEITPKTKEKRKIPKKLLVIGLLFLILVLGVVFLLNSISSDPRERILDPVNPDLSFVIYDRETDIVNYGKENENVVHFLINYQVNNAINLSAKVETFRDINSKSVYLLKSDRYEPQSSQFYEFKESLQNILVKEGYTFNEMTKQELFNLPESSIIIIPTGHIPRDFIFGENTIEPLVKKGHIIIFLGYPFNQVLNYDGNIMYIEQNETPFRFVFNSDLSSRDRLTPSGINLRSPVYKVFYNREDPNLIFGAISSFKIEEGFILFIPQYLDEGWINGTLASQDVFRVISESRWTSVISTSTVELNNESSTLSLISAPFVYNPKYAKVSLIAEGENEGITKRLEIVPISKSTFGEISMGVWPLHPYKITNSNVQMTIRFNEIPPSYSINPIMRIQSNGQLISTENIPQTISNTVISRSFSPNFEPGGYLITISEGKEFAKYFFEIEDIIPVEQTRSDFNRGNFRFRITDKYGNTVRYNQVVLSINGKVVKTFTNSEPIIIEDYQGLPSGENEFTFDFGDNFIRTLRIENRVSNPFMQIIENPVNLTLFIITIIAVGIALYIKRPEKQKYSLDIPDFPPVSTVKIPMRASEILEIFEKVNKDYSWNNMPLTLEELKNGFAKLSRQGRKIIVGEYNLELVLDKLIAKNLVKERDYYYTLTSWEEKTNLPVSYLVIFRRLRDMFIENVVKFSELGEEKEADLKIDVSGEKIYLHIFKKMDFIFNALKTIHLGQTIILFESEYQKEKFKENMTSSDALIVAFNLEVENGNIFLYTLEELEDFIKTAKVK